MQPLTTLPRRTPRIRPGPRNRLRGCALALIFPLIVLGQADDKKLEEINAKHARGEKLTHQEEEYHDRAIERRHQVESVKKHLDWAKEHPARDSTGLVPLNDLGKGVYQGEQGGLYPGGENTPPAAHLETGLRLASQMAPLDRNGRKSPNGRIVFISIGMSNTQQEARVLLDLGETDKQISPLVALVNGAQGAQTAGMISDPKCPYWKLVDSRVREADFTNQQVQALWLLEANGVPKNSFAVEAKRLEANLVDVLHILHDKFPNLKIAYLFSRVYAGYALVPLNPEPYAYESGFTVKWLIADQIAGKPELNCDPAKGPVRAPWISWGPYLWADGLKARGDGLIWKREDLAPDGTHPSTIGCGKVARLLLDFLKKDPTSQPWFVKE